MFKSILVTCFCIMNLNLSGLSNGKPIAALQPLENPELTTIQLPKASITGEELVALAQYVIGIMTSRINITLETTTSPTDFPRYSDHSMDDSASVQSTTPTVSPSKEYKSFENTKQIGNELILCADHKLQYPCRLVGGIINSGSLAQETGAHFMMNGRPSLTYEQFVRYAERNAESFPNDFGFELIPNSEISPTYIPQVEKNIGVLPLMEHVMNSPLLPPAMPITSVAGEKDSVPQNIRIRNLTIEQVPSTQSGNAVSSVPFEAVITFTRQKPSSAKLKVGNKNIEIPTRNPLDSFPPYFDSILSVGRKPSDSERLNLESTPSSLNLNQEKILSPAEDAANEVVPDEKQKVSKPMKKRQTSRVGEILQTIGLSAKRPKENRKRVAGSPTPSPLDVEPSKNMKPEKLTSITVEEFMTPPPIRGPMSQRQEIEGDEDEEKGGSLDSLIDLLPLITPILEDLSDPNTETDIAELLEAGLPLVQGISQGDGENEGVDLVGLVSPIFASLSGPNRDGNGTVFQAILPLILPLVTPFIGPIIGPIIRASSNPADQGGSSITPLIQALAGPLSLPTQPGGISIASSLISGIIASLSKDLKAGAGNGGSDITALVSTVVSGVISGGSAGIKAKFMKPPPSAHPGYAPYGQTGAPAGSSSG